MAPCQAEGEHRRPERALADGCSSSSDHGMDPARNQRRRIRRRAHRRNRHWNPERSAATIDRSDPDPAHGAAGIRDNSAGRRRGDSGHIVDHGERDQGRQLRVRAARSPGDRSGHHGYRGDSRHQRRGRVSTTCRPTCGAAPGPDRADRGAGNPLSRDRRTRLPGAPTSDAWRLSTQPLAVARRRIPRAARVGDGPLLADGRVAGGDPTRLER